MHVQIRTKRFQLCLATQAAGADTRGLGQVFDRRESHRAECISRIFAGGHCGDCELIRQLRRQVLQAVDSEINSIFGKRFLDLFDEHAFRSNFGEGHVGDFVAGGVDDLDCRVVTAMAKQPGNMICLPEGQLRPA